MRLLISVLSINAVLLGLAACTAGSDDGPVDVWVSKVVSANEVVVEIDEEHEHLRLAGIDVPRPTECMGPEALSEFERHARRGQEVTVNFDGEENGRRLVRMTDSGADVATQLVRAGVAVPRLLNGELPDAMIAATDEAMEREVGFFDPNAECTLAHEFARATENLAQAQDQVQPTDVAEAEAGIQAALASIVAAEAVRRALVATGSELRRTAYTAARLTQMATRLATDIASGRSVVTTLRRTKRALIAERHRERLERQREAERRRAAERQRELARQRERERNAYVPPPSYSSGDSSGSSGGSSGSGGGSDSGYTGPRCYEPGGTVWHPC